MEKHWGVAELVVSQWVKILTNLRISPMLTFMYATAVPAFQVAAQAYLRKQAKGSLRRERGLEGVANRVVAEACEMIKVVAQLPWNCLTASTFWTAFLSFLHCLH